MRESHPRIGGELTMPDTKDNRTNQELTACSMHILEPELGGERNSGHQIRHLSDQRTRDGCWRRRTFAFLVLATLCMFLAVVLNSDSTLATGLTIARSFVQRGSGEAISPNRQANRTKVAEGEYVIVEQGNSGAFGPFGEEIYDFHETWTLWRVAKGRYEVEGERRFESPIDVPHVNRFLAELSRDLTVTRVTEFAKLKWRRDSGPLTCEFLPSELHCSSDGRDPKQAIELRISMEHSFGILWPVSIFSLSSVTREAERDRNQMTPMQLVTIEQPSSWLPVNPTILDGTLQYLGDEDLEAADQKWHAHKFSFKVPSQPQFLIWTSSKGIPLALVVEHPHENWPEEGMKLVRFRK